MTNELVFVFEQSNPPIEVEFEDNRPEIKVESAAVGLVGPRGKGAFETTGLDITATTALSGHRLIVPTNTGAGVQYADHRNLEDLTKPLWLTVGAVSAGESPTLAVVGAVSEPSWSWTPHTRLYVGQNGYLTTSPPTSGYLRVVGEAVDSDTIWLNPQPAFALST